MTALGKGLGRAVREGLGGWGRGSRRGNLLPYREADHAAQKPHRTLLVSWTQNWVAQRRKLPFLLILTSQKGGGEEERRPWKSLVSIFI